MDGPKLKTTMKYFCKLKMILFTLFQGKCLLVALVRRKTVLNVLARKLMKLGINAVSYYARNVTASKERMMVMQRT